MKTKLIKLSVNLNKVATLRNARGGRVPSLAEAVAVVVGAGAPGVTVHPRADERHITAADVDLVAAELKRLPAAVEYNIEGDPRPDLIAKVRRVQPDQCTLVPVRPGEITSQAGWSATELKQVIGPLKEQGIRVALFVDAEEAPIRWAKEQGADRVELYTEPFARAFAAGRAQGEAAFADYVSAAELAHDLGLGINAGHDLDLTNLELFRELPHLDEVSIGHALISRALFVGLERVVQEYLDVLTAR